MRLPMLVYAREQIRFAQPAVDLAGEREPVVAEQVAEHDRRAAEHAAAEVVLRVADARARDVLGLEARPCSRTFLNVVVSGSAIAALSSSCATLTTVSARSGPLGNSADARMPVALR